MKKLWVLFLILSMILGNLGVFANDFTNVYADSINSEIVYGELTFGGTYSFNKNTGVLNVDGRSRISTDIAHLDTADEDFIKFKDRIKKIVISENTTGIGDFEFWRDYPSVVEVVIGNKVERIGNNAFGKLPNLKKLTLGGSVRAICEGAFSNCPQLNEIVVHNPNNIYVYEGAFQNCGDGIYETLYSDDGRTQKVLKFEKDKYESVGWHTTTQTTQCASNQITVTLNDKKIEFDVQPQTINGRTLVPMRKIFEELGAVVGWDNSTQTAMGTKENTVVKFTINDYTMYKNESANTLDVPAQLIDGRTLIPLRAVSEAFDCQVGWDGSTSTISIINDFENYTMLYALGDRSKSFPTDSISEQLTVGWYTEPVQMLYAPDKSAVFKKSEVPAQLTVGWSEEPFVTLYAVGGKKHQFKQSEVEAQKAVGWYEYPVIQVYANDGRTMVINESELSAYENVGWSKTNPEYKPLGRKISSSDIDVELIGTNFVINNKSEYSLEIDRLYVDDKYHEIVGTGKATVKPYEVKAVYCECDHGFSAHDTSSEAYIWVTQTVPRADGAEYRYVFKVSFTINGIYKFECIVG